MITERALCPILVGREDELTVLEDALLSAARGEGQVVVLAGDAGLGKTRLATELKHQAQKIGAAVMWGGCSEADLALPYLPFLEAIGNWLADADLQHLRTALGSAARELAQLFPQIHPDAAPGDQGDPTQAKLRLYEGVLALLRVAAEQRGALLVVEDLHWSDASTRELLDYMTRRIRGSRVIVLATYRRDEMHRKHPLLPIVQGWRRSRLAQIIELEPLAPERVGDMIRAIFSQESVSPEFRDFLHARAEGNPFVLEEMLKEAIDRGDIYRTEERWERKGLAELSLPRSVSDSILLRVERLDPSHADVVRAASVLGPALDYPTLVELTGFDESTVQAALHACVQQQLIEPDTTAASRYRFRHALTREAVYEDLILPRRQQLHGRAADVLGRDPATQAVDLAHHLLVAGRAEEAVPVCIRAAEEAERRGGWREANELYERALQHVPDATERGRLLCRVGSNLWSEGEAGAAVKYLEEGLPLLERAALTGDAAWYRMLLGRSYWDLSRPDLAREQYLRARDELEPLGPSEQLAYAYLRLAGMHNFDLEPEKALPLLEKGEDIARAAGSDSAAIFALVVRGVMLGYSARDEEGLALLERAYREAMERGLYTIAGTAIHNCVFVSLDALRASRIPQYVEMMRAIPGSPGWEEFDVPLASGVAGVLLGDIPAAAAALEASLAQARELGVTTQAAWAGHWLCCAYVEQGRFEEARPLQDESLDGLQRQDVVGLLVAKLYFSLGAGELDEALANARRAADEAQWLARFPIMTKMAVEAFVRTGHLEGAEAFLDAASRFPYDERHPDVAIAKARVALGRGDAQEAVRLLDSAADRAAEAGYRTDETEARCLLSEAFAAIGDDPAAQASARAAHALATVTGSVLWQQRVADLAATLGVPLDAAATTVEETPVQPESAATAERLVTVMFADVRGYTAMTHRQAPAEMHDRITAFYRWARREIEQRSGMVDSYAGDAVMASFNVREATLDHALRAVQAGIALQDKAALMDLPVGVGVAVGPAIVGRMTGGTNVDVIGETPNLAARLQAQAQSGEMLLSEEAYRRVRSWLEQQGMRSETRLLSLKGFEGQVTAYALRGSVASGASE